MPADSARRSRSGPHSPLLDKPVPNDMHVILGDDTSSDSDSSSGSRVAAVNSRTLGRWMRNAPSQEICSPLSPVSPTSNDGTTSLNVDELVAQWQADFAKDRQGKLDRAKTTPDRRSKVAESSPAISEAFAQRSSGRKRTSSTGRRPGSALRATKEEELTDVDGLWDLLSSEQGQMQTRILITDVSDLWQRGLTAGWQTFSDMMLNLHGSGQPPQPLAAADVTALSLVVLDDPLTQELPSEEELRERMEQARMEGRKPEQDHEIGVRQFRKVMNAIVLMTHLDEEFLLMHLVWVLTDRFEMNEELATWVAELTANVHLRDRPSKPEIRFARNEFMRWIHACDVADNSGTKGIPWANLAALFTAVLATKEQLLRNRARGRRPGQVNKMPARRSRGTASDTLTGRTEFSLLCEAVYEAMPESAGFVSPLDMCTQFLQRGGFTAVELPLEARRILDGSSLAFAGSEPRISREVGDRVERSSSSAALGRSSSKESSRPGSASSNKASAGRRRSRLGTVGTSPTSIERQRSRRGPWPPPAS